VDKRVKMLNNSTDKTQFESNESTPVFTYDHLQPTDGARNINPSAGTNDSTVWRSCHAVVIYLSPSVMKLCKSLK
jgi:hypothetical protein